MRIDIESKIKCVCVWLTAEESERADINKKIDEITEKYKGTKFKVVIFRSGRRDLYGLTEGLIKYNKDWEENKLEKAIGF
ncbi:MAG: hypothetical protein IJL89_03605 [Firmicutes bacterium]|nr:hypothetical protein [Bacillota bacterium]